MHCRKAEKENCGRRNKKKKAELWAQWKVEALQEKKAEKNKSEHLVSLRVFITSSTPVAHNKAQPRGPPVLLRSYLHDYSGEQWGKRGQGK